jgi:hypothetical protein
MGADRVFRGPPALILPEWVRAGGADIPRFGEVAPCRSGRNIGPVTTQN